MRRTLIDGLTQAQVQAVVNSYVLTQYYYPTLFPLAFTPTLTWKGLEATAGAPIAADVISFNSPTPKKSRPIVETTSGDIPKLGIAREMDEHGFNKYIQLRAYANTTEGLQALLDFVFEDVEFCFTGVNARLEWLALQAASRGQVSLSNGNNNSAVTETVVDFLVPAENKMGVTKPWNDITATPIKDLKKVVTAAKKKGVTFTRILMDDLTFDYMIATEEVIKATAGFVLQVTGLPDRTPTIETINRALVGQRLPPISVIESYITIEKTNGDQETIAPWEEGKVTFMTGGNMGKTYHGPQADDIVESSVAIKASRGHVLIKKFAQEDPIIETTKGTANAFPVLASPKKVYILDTKRTTFQVA